MLKLRKPTDVPAEVFLRCVNGVKDLELRARFQRVAPDIQAAAEAFEAAATAGELYTLKEEEAVAGTVTGKEMSRLYEKRMARERSPGRDIYDNLMVLTPKCPLCGHRLVSVLDHHLPRAKFPALAVTPSNLIPACSDCNKAKGASIPRTAEEQTVHPYFDDFGQEPWLSARVVESSPPTLHFSVQPPATWPALWGARVRHHFKTFQLGKLYRAHAAEELVNIQHLLVKHLKANADKVREQLRGQADSHRKVNPNSWQTAMYEALGASEWFCAEGFLRISSRSL